ncbi:MAG: hypothetical protein AAGI37_03025 [Planctomycetota bacterium]
MSHPTTHNATQQVFELVLARPVAAPDLQQGGLVHLLWRAPHQGDRLVQVYLNGRLSGASRSITEREAWLVVDHNGHTEIELLAVSPSAASTDLASELAGVQPATQPSASVTLLRDHGLPVDASVSASVLGHAGRDRAPLFSPTDARGGFGAVFGEGGFGYDAATGPGLGLGELGFGPLGSGGGALRWRNDSLQAGTHTLDLSLNDPAGRPAAESLSLELTIDRLPAPPQDVAVAEPFNLTWT